MCDSALVLQSLNKEASSPLSVVGGGSVGESLAWHLHVLISLNEYICESSLFHAVVLRGTACSV